MPSAGDNLSLGALGKAVGVNGNTTTQTALAANGRGSTGTQTSLSDFYISAVNSTISGVADTTPDESSNDSVTIGFSDEGSLFTSRIKTVTSNFTWAGGTSVTVGGTKDYRATINFGSVSSNTATSFSVTFEDFFNTQATRYDSAVTQNVTIQNDSGGGGVPPGDRFCFVGDTLVTMADGTYKPIENIEVGDLVFTQIGNERVKEIVLPVHNNIVELSFSNGNSTKNTDDHPYYIIDKGWCSMKPQLSTELYDVKCQQLVVGDIFIDDEDTQIELLNIEKVNGEFKTYTFSTNSKTYYANKLLVHSEI